MNKISAGQKTTLIILGLFLSLVLIEMFLRIGGFAYLSLQEYRNQKSIKEKGEYRILCLGESTTMGQWPGPLENVLNSRNTGLKFSAIDKGMAGTNTGVILSCVKNYIDKYSPHMIITMMGVNDLMLSLPVNQRDKKKGPVRFFKSLKIYKLAIILQMNISFKIEEIKRNGIFPGHRMRKEISEKIKKENIRDCGEYVELGQDYIEQGELKKAEEVLKKALLMDPESLQAHIELGFCYESRAEYNKAKKLYEKALSMDPERTNEYIKLGQYYQRYGEYEKAEELFAKAISLDPESIEAYSELGQYYCVRREYEKAENMYKKAISLDPTNVWSYHNLGECYKNWKKHEKAENMYKKVISLDPANVWSYYNLGECYKNWKKYEKAENMYKKVISLDPTNVWPYSRLGECYKDCEEYDKEEKMLKKAIAVDHDNAWAYFQLGKHYKGNKEYDKAEKILKKAIALDPKNIWNYIEVARCYCEQGRNYFDKAEKILKKGLLMNPDSDMLTYKLIYCKQMISYSGKKVDDKVFEYYIPNTVSNYRKIKEIADREKIELVCVQYPVRKVESLKNIFQNKEDIIFVDNEMSFKNALKQEGYDAYFCDMFGKDFGHCTMKGNRLLAENIADVILEEIINRKEK
ncbi:tetratricopeptide repeat protein [Elusimicrobiota bacterium]